MQLKKAKTVIILVMSITISATLLAMSSPSVHAPEAVLTAFKAKFPSATKVSWGKENAHEYEAEFMLNGKKMSANFSEAGAWIETESTVLFQDLPQKVQQSFNAKHKGTTIQGVAMIESAKGIIKYEVEVKQNGKTVELFYNADGTQTKE